MKVSIGSDHAGYELKQGLVRALEIEGILVIDRGTHSKESVDYPEFAQKVAQDIIDEEVELGILICDTGIGISISANKFKGIRAALVYNEDGAERSRSHNDANVICIGSKYTPLELAQKLIKIFLETPFEGGRHERRVKQIEQQETYLNKDHVD